ncbi:hypothetical protein AK812_SmicGene3179 [Symbiodinium microadriaticum]|uniref:Uncharacterized protein n=1 Tax=Symbiodinium microadriaticum TaxID=2951 RepID=A0A1Q9EZM4_SYMMI|nr:hypothetical protein AK812_SmicGene3179 [Symbiodinium microadriaticum]
MKNMMDGGADDELLMQLKFTTVRVMVRKMRVLKRKKMMLTMAPPVLKLQVVAFLTTMVAATTVDGDVALLLMLIQVLTLMIMLLMNHEDVDEGTVDHGEHVDLDGGYGGGAHVDAQDMLLRPPMMMLIMVMRRICKCLFLLSPKLQFYSPTLVQQRSDPDELQLMRRLELAAIRRTTLACSFRRQRGHGCGAVHDGLSGRLSLGTFTGFSPLAAAVAAAARPAAAAAARIAFLGLTD